MKKIQAALAVDVWLFAIVTVLLAITIGVVLLNPIWIKLAIPGMFPSHILPPITAPVDGLYYILNADLGYRWTTHDPLSLWFHPLLSWLLKLFPQWLSTNYWFWIISIVFAVGCLPLIYHLISILSGSNQLPAWMLPLCLLAPGGLSLATGNAEIPNLFFVLILLLSVLDWQKWWLTLSSATFAILTKPNSLYMVPILIVYFIIGLERQNIRLWRQALIGMMTILFIWLLWSWIVDWETGYPGIYWKVRLLAKYYLGEGDIGGFFEQFIASFYNHDVRNVIRYSTALLIPFTNLLVIGLIPLSDESHRYAMAAGNLAMLAITLYLGNPNKIIVYTTTLPGHFAGHLLLLNTIIKAPSTPVRLPRLGIAAIYGLYCLTMIFVFVVGTPIRWYH